MKIDFIDYYLVGEAAEKLEISRDTLLRWTKEGKIEAKRIKHKSLFWRAYPRESVDALRERLQDKKRSLTEE